MCFAVAYSAFAVALLSGEFNSPLRMDALATLLETLSMRLYSSVVLAVVNTFYVSVGHLREN